MNCAVSRLSLKFCAFVVPPLGRLGSQFHRRIVSRSTRNWVQRSACAKVFTETARTMTTTTTIGFKKVRGTGDQGQSSLFSNERRWKDDAIFEALGTVDELSSLIGICREQLATAGFVREVDTLTKVQCCLQDIGSHVATPPDSSSASKIARTRIDFSLVDEINSTVDYYGDQLPQLKSFILPGGGEMAAQLQYARSLARRCERTLVSLVREEAIDSSAVKYVNRLSDLLFVMGRYICMKEGKQEAVYQKPKDFDPVKVYQTKELS